MILLKSLVCSAIIIAEFALLLVYSTDCLLIDILGNIGVEKVGRDIGIPCSQKVI